MVRRMESEWSRRPRNAQHEAPHAWTNGFKEVEVDWELIRGLSFPLLSHAFHLSLPVFHPAFMQGTLMTPMILLTFEEELRIDICCCWTDEIVIPPTRSLCFFDKSSMQGQPRGV